MKSLVVVVRGVLALIVLAHCSESLGQGCDLGDGVQIVSVSGEWSYPGQIVEDGTCRVIATSNRQPIECHAFQHLRSGVDVRVRTGSIFYDLTCWPRGELCDCFALSRGVTSGDMHVTLQIVVDRSWLLDVRNRVCDFCGVVTVPYSLARLGGGSISSAPLMGPACSGSSPQTVGSSHRLTAGAYEFSFSASYSYSSNGSGCGSAIPSIGLKLRSPELMVPRDASSIQAAIDLVPSGESGWFVLVPEGNYEESIDFKGKSVTVKAIGSREGTVLDGTMLSGSVVRATSGETPAAMLQGFTIREGVQGSLEEGRRMGGGMLIRSASPTVRDCAFLLNSAQAGGALALVDSHSLIDGCAFESNDAGSGGAVWIDGGAPTVSGCLISGNRAFVHGGGIHATPSSMQLPDVVLSGNTICGNASADAGRENVWALFEDDGNSICDCFGDVDGNGIADPGDIAMSLLFFGGATDPEFIQPDQDMNGLVDTGDIALILLGFGPCE
jgi:hypothetical protein